jgi:hypothetical protein
MNKLFLPRSLAPLSWYGYVLSLKAFRAVNDLKLDIHAFFQRTISRRLDRGVVDENVLAGFTLDETVAFSCVEPLYTASFVHLEALLS